MNDVKLSVCMITYNHESFISKAIEGVLMQKTDFPIDLIIGEDCSTDKTQGICIEYKEKYPRIIKLRLPDKNMGVMPNFIENLKTCTGKYIAICEGDDYWTDPYKLQKQVDFLEANKEFSLCFHNSLILDENNNTTTEALQRNGLRKNIFYTEDLITQWFIPTSGIVFVKDCLKLPAWFSNVQSGDIALILLLSLKGPARYLDEVMSVYRLHPNGLSNTHIGYHKFLSMCYLYQTFNIHTNYKFNEKIIQEIKYEFERHALGYETEKLAETELKKLLAGTESLSRRVSFRQTLVLLLYKLKLDRIYKVMRRGLKG